MADFAESVLATHLRRDSAQAAIKTKLRGRKLLLESAATVGIGEAATRRPRGAKARGSSSSLACAGSSRASRRGVLLAAAREVTYEQLRRQHALWQTYAAETLRGANDAAEAAHLADQMDWHGARVRVLRSACQAYAHAEGLVLVETQRMLLLLSESKRVWLPKAGLVVELSLPPGLRAGQAVQLEADKHVA